MSKEGRYVDVDALKIALMGIYPTSNGSYANGIVEQQIANMINTTMLQSLDAFKHQLISAIEKAGKPYDKCMLCVQRDTCVPEHPLGDNR